MNYLNVNKTKMQIKMTKYVIGICSFLLLAVSTIDAQKRNVLINVLDGGEPVVDANIFVRTPANNELMVGRTNSTGSLEVESILSVGDNFGVKIQLGNKKLFDFEDGLTVGKEDSKNKFTFNISPTPLEPDAKTNNISVEVYDYYGKKPLSGINVSIRSANNENTTIGVTSENGILTIKSLPLGDDYDIRVWHEKYGFQKKENLVVSAVRRDNKHKFKLAQKTQLHGSIKAAKKESILDNTSINVSINSASPIVILSDLNGEFVMMDLLEGDDIKMTISKPGYMPYEVSRTLQRAKKDNNFIILLEKEYSFFAAQVYAFPKTNTVSILGLGAIIYGAVKFNTAANIYSDYKNHTKEVSFIEIRPEFVDREEAYQRIETKRKNSLWLAGLGAAGILGSQIWIRKAEKRNGNANLSLHVDPLSVSLSMVF